MSVLDEIDLEYTASVIARVASKQRELIDYTVALANWVAETEIELETEARISEALGYTREGNHAFRDAFRDGVDVRSVWETEQAFLGYALEDLEK